MLRDFKILKIILPFIIPYIFLYTIYIQLNGEISPGGGFQAGVLFASGFIAYDFVFDSNRVKASFSSENLVICGALGVFIYAGTGVASLLKGHNFLDYDALLEKNTSGQHLGIFLIEIGVGITVASIMCLIYSLLRDD